MNSLFVKALITLLLITIIYNYKTSQQDKIDQQKLQQEVSELKQHIVEKDIRLSEQEIKANLKSEKHLLEIKKQVDESKKQTKLITQQIESLNKVTENLAEKQQIEIEMMTQAKKNNQDALKAFYISQGLQMASRLKIHIAEYYFSHDKFPNRNADLKISSPTQFATEATRSIWVSKGGKIIIVYTQKSGVDKGTVNLTPKYKNNEIQWQCSSKDFKQISLYIPQCKLLSG